MKINTMWVSIFFLFVVLALSGCETVQGVGRDIQNVGSTTQRALSRR